MDFEGGKVKVEAGSKYSTEDLWLNTSLQCEGDLKPQVLIKSVQIDNITVSGNDPSGNNVISYPLVADRDTIGTVEIKHEQNIENVNGAANTEQKFMSTHSKFSHGEKCGPCGNEENPADITHSHEGTDITQFQELHVSDMKHQELTDITHWRDLTDTIHFPELSDITHSQDLTDTIHFPELSDIKPCQELSNIKHSEELTDIIHLQELPDIKHSQELSDVTHSQDLTDTIHFPELSDIKHCQELSDIKHSLELTDITHSQELTDITHFQELTDITHFQELSDTTPSPELDDITSRQNLTDVTRFQKPFNAAGCSEMASDHVVGNSKLHKSTGDSELYKSDGGSELHKLDGDSQLHKSDDDSELHKLAGDSELHKSATYQPVVRLVRMESAKIDKFSFDGANEKMTVTVTSKQPVNRLLDYGFKSVKTAKLGKRKPGQSKRKKAPIKVGSPFGIRLPNRLVMEAKDNSGGPGRNHTATATRTVRKPMLTRKQRRGTRTANKNDSSGSVGQRKDSSKTSGSVGVQDQPSTMVPYPESVEGSEPSSVSAALEQSSHINQVGSNIKRRRRSQYTTKKTNFLCKICNRYFARIDTLRIHTKSFHSSISSDQKVLGEPAGTVDGIALFRTADGYICDVCNKTFPSHYWWRRHRLIHFGKGGLTFTCKVCGQTFNDLVAINRHMNTHDLKIPEKNVVTGSNQPPHYTIANVKVTHQNSHVKKQTNVKTSNRHSCKVCGKCFPSRSKLRSHTMVHTGEKPFTCNICNKSFGHPNNLKTHADTHNDKTNRLYQCQECDKTYSQRVQLKRHVLKYHLTMRQEALKLPLPIYGFTSGKSMRGQGKKKKKLTRISGACGTAPDTVNKTAATRKQTRRARTFNKSDSSGIVGQTEDSSLVFVAIEDQPLAMVPYSKSAEGSEAPTMSTSWERSSQINREGSNVKRRRRAPIKSIHSDISSEEPVKKLLDHGLKSVKTVKPGRSKHGEICKRYFARIDTLRIHTKSFHSSISSDQKVLGEPAGSVDGIALFRTADGYTCDVCNKTFPSHYRWRRHRLIHFGKGGLTFTCKVCGQTFDDLVATNRHMNTHDLKIPEKNVVTGSNQPPHYTIANIKVTHQNSLAKKQTNVKTSSRHSCKVCGKCFSTRAYLRFHTMVHTGEKPYTCDICNKSIGHPNNLKTHADTHNDKTNRLYQCQECDKTFSQRVHLKRHVLKYHLTMRQEALKLPLPICGFTSGKRKRGQGKKNKKLTRISGACGTATDTVPKTVSTRIQTRSARTFNKSDSSGIVGQTEDPSSVFVDVEDQGLGVVPYPESAEGSEAPTMSTLLKRSLQINREGSNIKSFHSGISSEEPVKKLLDHGLKSVKKVKPGSRKYGQSKKKNTLTKMSGAGGIRLTRNRHVADDETQTATAACSVPKPMSTRRQKRRAGTTNKSDNLASVEEAGVVSLKSNTTVTKVASPISVDVQDQVLAMVDLPYPESANISASGSCGMKSECVNAPLSDFGDASWSDPIGTVAQSSMYHGSVAEGSEPPTISASQEQSSWINQEGKTVVRSRAPHFTSVKTNFRCNICTRRYATEESVRTHIKYIHSDILSSEEPVKKLLDDGFKSVRTTKAGKMKLGSLTEGTELSTIPTSLPQPSHINQEGSIVKGSFHSAPGGH